MRRRSWTGSAVRDVVAVEEDAPARRLDEAVDHAQERRLPAARRADEHRELAVGELDRESRTATVPFGYCLRTDSSRINAIRTLLSLAAVL